MSNNNIFKTSDLDDFESSAEHLLPRLAQVQVLEYLDDILIVDDMREFGDGAPDQSDHLLVEHVAELPEIVAVLVRFAAVRVLPADVERTHVVGVLYSVRDLHHLVVKIIVINVK